MGDTSEQIVGLLITVGDELLLGDIPNGNSHHIACELRSRGFRIGRMVTVGDAKEEIARALSEAPGEFRFVVATGGLGPTEDDRTAITVAELFCKPLTPCPRYEKWLRDYYAERGRQWTDRMVGFTRIPRGAVKLIAETPMAGFMLEHQDVPWYFLPGVPGEMRELLAHRVIPDLESRFPNRSVYLKRLLRVQGLPESEIGLRLEDLSRQQALGVDIGYLPQCTENWVTLLAVARSVDEARERIERAVDVVTACLGAENISGGDHESIAETVGRQLRKKCWKMAAAESCTGGLLSRMVTSVPGASDYFDRAFITYSNEAKVDLLGVPEDLLRVHGAVSRPVALAMARGARERAGVDVALAITGIAGPTGGTPEKPVGTVYIACATALGSVVERYLFVGAREEIRERSAHEALVLLWRMLSR